MAPDSDGSGANGDGAAGGGADEDSLAGLPAGLRKTIEAMKECYLEAPARLLRERTVVSVYRDAHELEDDSASNGDMGFQPVRSKYAVNQCA